MAEQVQKARKTVDVEIPVFEGTAEERVAALEAEIRNTESDLASVQERRAAAQERLSTLNGEYAALRAERGAALAAGEDASAITKKLRNISEQVEASQDAIAALSPQVPDLAGRKKALVEARRSAARDVAKTALRIAARRYNEKAAELVPVLQALWDARAASNEGGTGRVAAAPAGWDQGALSNIPRIYVDEDGPSLNEVTREGFFHADAKSYAANTASRQRAEFEAKQAGAGEAVDA